MEILYRVEDKYGRGCYNGMPRDGSRLDRMIDNHSTDGHHPTPQRDIGREPYIEEQCAFRSLDSLRNWFTAGELEMLRGYGYNVVKFIAEVTAVGERQVLYESRTKRKTKILLGFCNESTIAGLDTNFTSAGKVGVGCSNATTG